MFKQQQRRYIMGRLQHRCLLLSAVISMGQTLYASDHYTQKDTTSQRMSSTISQDTERRIREDAERERQKDKERREREAAMSKKW